MAQMQRVSGVSTVIGSDADMFYVQYHATKVVKWNEHEIVLNSGGWRTATTKTRINQTANQFSLDFNVYQKDYEWFVALPNGKHVAFDDNMRLVR